MNQKDDAHRSTQLSQQTNRRNQAPPLTDNRHEHFARAMHGQRRHAEHINRKHEPNAKTDTDRITAEAPLRRPHLHHDTKRRTSKSTKVRTAIPQSTFNAIGGYVPHAIAN